MQLVVNNRRVGELTEDGILIKRGSQVQEFRNYNGFGVAEAVIDNPEIHKIIIETGGKVYEATTDRFRIKGVPYHHPAYEPQIILRKQDFTVYDPNQTRMI